MSKDASFSLTSKVSCLVFQAHIGALKGDPDSSEYKRFLKTQLEKQPNQLDVYE